MKQFRRAYKDATTILSFNNAHWLSICSLFQRGGQYPLCPAGRLVCIVWWFGVMMFTALYTANLAATLTTAGLSGTKIKTFEDLANEDKLSYGTIENSTVWNYFENANESLYIRMRKQMAKQPKKSFYRTMSKSLSQVRNGSYVLIWYQERLLFESIIDPCDLKVASEVISKVPMAYALRKGSPHTQGLSIAMLQMQEQGLQERLMKSWFHDHSQCSHIDLDTGLKPSKFEDLTGIFLVMYGLMVVGVVALVIEWIVSCYVFSKSEAGREKGVTSLCAAINYRLLRMNRDILLYYTPARYMRRDKFQKRASQIANLLRVRNAAKKWRPKSSKITPIQELRAYENKVSKEIQTSRMPSRAQTPFYSPPPVEGVNYNAWSDEKGPIDDSAKEVERRKPLYRRIYTKNVDVYPDLSRFY